MPRPPPSSTLFPYTTLFRSRTQVLPTSAVDVRRLARTLGMTPEQFTTRYQRTRRRVRQLHEERSEEHTSELQSRGHLVCRLLLEKKQRHSALIDRQSLHET